MRNRRRFSRYLFGVDAQLSNPGSTEASDITVVNISPHGGCLDGAFSLEVGQRRVLTIAWRGTQIRGEAEVLWNDGEGRAGFRFLSVDQKNRNLLKELCSTLQLLRFASPPEAA